MLRRSRSVFVPAPVLAGKDASDVQPAGEGFFFFPGSLHYGLTAPPHLNIRTRLFADFQQKTIKQYAFAAYGIVKSAWNLSRKRISINVKHFVTSV